MCTIAEVNIMILWSGARVTSQWSFMRVPSLRVRRSFFRKTPKKFFADPVLVQIKFTAPDNFQFLISILRIRLFPMVIQVGQTLYMVYYPSRYLAVT